MSDDSGLRLRRLSTSDLSGAEVRAIRALMDVAFGPDVDDRFTEDDWQHAIGGMHFVLDVGDEIVAHASVVRRELHVDGQPLRTGYVEAVATAPRRQRQGFGTVVMQDVGSYVRGGFQLGALGTGSNGFYERLGWLTWQGPSSVRTTSGALMTPDDDGYIMVLRTSSSPAFELTGPISCEWRPADVW
ncbi:MAG: GNAT family N-acetyltransferase [Chloroflexota bacterium]|nr:GNAT family N-acetyltransferase [Chloroflexota bacterium]